MAKDAICKARLEATATMCKSFYTDFMPMIQHIKNKAESIKINEQNTDALNNILEQVEHAESLLKQMQKFSESQGVKND